MSEEQERLNVLVRRALSFGEAELMAKRLFDNVVKEQKDHEKVTTFHTLAEGRAWKEKHTEILQRKNRYEREHRAAKSNREKALNDIRDMLPAPNKSYVVLDGMARVRWSEASNTVSILENT